MGSSLGTYIKHKSPHLPRAFCKVDGPFACGIRDHGEDLALETYGGTVFIVGFGSFAGGFGERLTGLEKMIWVLRFRHLL